MPLVLVGGVNLAFSVVSGDLLWPDRRRPAIRRRSVPDSVMPLVLLGALKLALGVVLVDRGAVQAAVRYSLMSPAQVG